jgi:hypothetical protein
MLVQNVNSRNLDACDPWKKENNAYFPFVIIGSTPPHPAAIRLETLYKSTCYTERRET